MRLFASALAACLLLAGCASRDAPADALVDPATGDAEAANATRVEVAEVNGTITHLNLGYEEGGSSVCCVGAPPSGENFSGTLRTGPGTVRVVATLTWSDPLYDLDLTLYAPGRTLLLPPRLEDGRLVGADKPAYWDGEGALGSPDRNATVVVDDPRWVESEGDWVWKVDGEPAVDVAFHLRIEVERRVDAPAPG
ncbi:MAG TPA: hypothetical protein VHH36_01740 [Candidatus Thermoplasmatota archaeon]|nr:hypothetical protein [Candidatus Thermoplasmatota archaeon]